MKIRPDVYRRFEDLSDEMSENIIRAHGKIKSYLKGGHIPTKREIEEIECNHLEISLKHQMLRNLITGEDNVSWLPKAKQRVNG